MSENERGDASGGEQENSGLTLEGLAALAGEYEPLV